MTSSILGGEGGGGEASRGQDWIIGENSELTLNPLNSIMKINLWNYKGRVLKSHRIPHEYCNHALFAARIRLQQVEWFQ